MSKKDSKGCIEGVTKGGIKYTLVPSCNPYVEDKYIVKLNFFGHVYSHKLKISDVEELQEGLGMILNQYKELRGHK